MAKKPPAGKAKPKSKAKAGAKGRSIKNAAGATNPAPTMKNEIKQISEADFQALHRRRTSLKKQSKEINGSASDLLAKAADKNLDKPANAFIEKLWAMSPQKRATTLTCFDYYRTIPHFETKKKLDDAPEQAELDIPRQEAGAGKGGAPAKDPTGASAKNPAETKTGDAGDGKVVDLRPPHLRTPDEGGTKVDHVDDLKRAAGASSTPH